MSGSNGRRRMMVVQPLREEGDRARALGFQMQMHHDPASRTMRIRLVPQTDRAKQACRVASGSTQAHSIEAGVVYGVMDSIQDVASATAEVALARAREVMGG